MEMEEFISFREEIEIGSQNSHLGDEIGMDEPTSSDLEMMNMETDGADLSASHIENDKTNTVEFSSGKGDEVTHGKLVFSKEPPLFINENYNASACCSAEKFKSRLSAADSEPGKTGRKLGRQDRIELGKVFQGAVSSHDWELTESLILLADPQTLNDALCISLDSIWFMTTQEELYRIIGLIKKIIAKGAYDFT